MSSPVLLSSVSSPSGRTCLLQAFPEWELHGHSGRLLHSSSVPGPTSPAGRQGPDCRALSSRRSVGSLWAREPSQEVEQALGAAQGARGRRDRDDQLRVLQALPSPCCDIALVRHRGRVAEAAAPSGSRSLSDNRPQCVDLLQRRGRAPSEAFREVRALDGLEVSLEPASPSVRAAEPPAERSQQDSPPVQRAAVSSRGLGDTPAGLTSDHCWALRRASRPRRSAEWVASERSGPQHIEHSRAARSYAELLGRPATPDLPPSRWGGGPPPQVLEPRASKREAPTRQRSCPGVTSSTPSLVKAQLRSRDPAGTQQVRAPHCLHLLDRLRQKVESLVALEETLQDCSLPAACPAAQLGRCALVPALVSLAGANQEGNPGSPSSIYPASCISTADTTPRPEGEGVPSFFPTTPPGPTTTPPRCRVAAEPRQRAMSLASGKEARGQPESFRPASISATSRQAVRRAGWVG
ncbi:unnamed protein product [Polarella glacialis]|uniref:Uncharacterized protein n=1 Tax=Polarella glacialis TaxID=89957 RepID=A0A813E620_POLGL|nr:unnamed protein product [Polarella glacialis]